MAHAVPLGLSHIGLLKEHYVTVAVPLGFEMHGQSPKTIWQTLCHWHCLKKFDKRSLPVGLSKEIAERSLCNSRCAIGIVKRNCQKKSV